MSIATMITTVRDLLRTELNDPNAKRITEGRNWIFDNVPLFSAKSWPLVGVTCTIFNPKTIGLTGGRAISNEYIVTITTMIPVKLAMDGDSAMTMLGVLEGEIIAAMRDNMSTFQTASFCQPIPFVGNALVTSNGKFIMTQNYRVRERV